MKTNINNRVTVLFLALFTVGFLFAGSASAYADDNLQIEKYEKEYNLSSLSFDKVLATERILKDLYSLRQEENLTIINKDIRLLLYTINNDALLNYDNIPHSFVEITSSNKRVRLGLLDYQPAKKILYEIPKTKIPMLAIEDTFGGNCMNCLLFHIVTLDDPHFLHVAGKVSRIIDVDKDGVNDLVYYDATFENGLDILCHADSPTALILMTIKNGKLVSDIQNHMTYYKNKIQSLTTDINNFPTSIPPQQMRLLSRILEKFLIYRIISDEKQGWLELKKDLQHYDTQYFYLTESLRTRDVDKIEIRDIIKRIKASLNQKNKE